MDVIGTLADRLIEGISDSDNILLFKQIELFMAG